MMDATGKMLHLYLARALKGEKRELEMVHLCVFLLDLSATMFELVDEVMVAIPKDQHNDQMKLGLQQMQAGLIQTYEGSLVTASDVEFLTPQSRVMLLAGVLSNFPRIQAFLPDTVIAEFRRKVSEMESGEKNEQVREMLGRIRENIRTYRK
jgi:hypothetical protein